MGLTWLRGPGPAAGLARKLGARSRPASQPATVAAASPVLRIGGWLLVHAVDQRDGFQQGALIALHGTAQEATVLAREGPDKGGSDTDLIGVARRIARERGM